MRQSPDITGFWKGFSSTSPFPYCLLLVIVGVVFGNSLGHEFVWDDQIYLLNKPVYQTVDLRRIFLSLANDLEYLPVRDLSYTLDYAIWGRNPFGFHLTNLIIYALSVLLVHRLTKRLVTFLAAPPAIAPATARRAALLGAALFAVHPVHAEVVNFITGRNALLSGLFSLLACLAFLSYLSETRRRRIFYAGAIGCFTLALFSKATALTLPLVFLLIILMSHRERKLSLVASLAPFLGLAAGSFFLFRTIAMRSFLMSAENACFTPACIVQKIAIASQIPFFYLGKLLLPVRLMPEYVVDFPGDFANPLVMLALLVLLGMSVAAFLLRKAQPQFLFSLGWLLLTMVPVLHLFPTYPVVADRYAYLPSFGFIYLLAVTGSGWATSHRRSRLLVVGTSALLLLLGVLTMQQNRVWHSGETLWQHTLSISPRSVKAYTNLGRIYFSAGRYAEAFALFDQARRIEPSDPHYDFFEGMLFFVRSDYGQALPHFNRALTRANGFLEALFHTAMAHEALGQRDQAITFFARTVQSKQDDLGGFRTLAKEHLQHLEQQ